MTYCGSPWCSYSILPTVEKIMLKKLARVRNMGVMCRRSSGDDQKTMCGGVKMPMALELDGRYHGETHKPLLHDDAMPSVSLAEAYK